MNEEKNNESIQLSDEWNRPKEIDGAYLRWDRI